MTRRISASSQSRPLTSEKTAPVASSAIATVRARAMRRARPRATMISRRPTRLASMCEASVKGSGSASRNRCMRSHSAGRLPDRRRTTPPRKTRIAETGATTRRVAAMVRPETTRTVWRARENHHAEQRQRGKAERQHVVDQAEDDERGDHVRSLPGAEPDQDRRFQHADAARCMLTMPAMMATTEDHQEDGEAEDDVRAAGARKARPPPRRCRSRRPGSAPQCCVRPAAASPSREARAAAGRSRARRRSRSARRGSPRRSADRPAGSAVEQRHADGIDEESRADQRPRGRARR